MPSNMMHTNEILRKNTFLEKVVTQRPVFEILPMTVSLSYLHFQIKNSLGFICNLKLLQLGFYITR